MKIQFKHALFVIAVICLFSISGCAETWESVCIRNNGKWDVESNAPNVAKKCFNRAPDAGKMCTDSAQCQSKYCVAPTNLTKTTGMIQGVCYDYLGNVASKCDLEIKDGNVVPKACS